MGPIADAEPIAAGLALLEEVPLPVVRYSFAVAVAASAAHSAAGTGVSALVVHCAACAPRLASRRTRGWNVCVCPAGFQALETIAHCCTWAAAAPGAAASTVTMKPLEALPPEFVAVTVTSVPGSGAAVGIETRPVRRRSSPRRR